MVISIFWDDPIYEEPFWNPKWHINAGQLALQLIEEYLTCAGHGKDPQGLLFRYVKNNAKKDLVRPLQPVLIYSQVVRHYARKAGVDHLGFVC